MEQIESRLASLDWMIALLYEAQKPLIAERDRLRRQEAKQRERDLRKAREFLGEDALIGGE